MTLAQATLALVKDHTYGRHIKDHPDCPVCEQRGDMGLFYREPAWVRRMHEQGLPVRVERGGSVAL